MNNFLYYLITDPKYYTSNSIKLKIRILNIKRKVDIICFRDKKSKNFKKLANSFLKISKIKKYPLILLNTDVSLAYRLKFDGIHLPSSKIKDIKKAKRKKLFVIVSTHNLDELKIAQKYGADAATYSPIFFTPNKENPKGLKSLRIAVYKDKIPILALGGVINRYQINKVKLKKAKGFASIRYFARR